MVKRPILIRRTGIDMELKKELALSRVIQDEQFRKNKQLKKDIPRKVDY
jgi:hypothetical protein